MASGNCSKPLDDSLSRATPHLAHSFVLDAALQEKIAYVIGCPSNRAGARFLMACARAKLDNPRLDIRKPFVEVYTEAVKKNAFSGRGYDEQFIFDFITKHKLPCSSTTAFLTPGFRTKNIVLTKDQELRGRPAQMYGNILEILDAVFRGRLSPRDLLDESVRLLIIERDNRRKRLEALLDPDYA